VSGSGGEEEEDDDDDDSGGDDSAICGEHVDLGRRSEQSVKCSHNTNLCKHWHGLLVSLRECRNVKRKRRAANHKKKKKKHPPAYLADGKKGVILANAGVVLESWPQRLQQPR
jgi:hypothetical protein